ncbi:hypothetical protein [Okibacterium endophyticum]
MANRNYAGSRKALTDRLAFPGGHKLDDFPRTLVINAEQDNMRTKSRASSPTWSDRRSEHTGPESTRPTDRAVISEKIIAGWTNGHSVDHAFASAHP